MKDRLDKILVAKGLAKSRELARSLIIEGKVFVDGTKFTKAGTLVSETSDIILRDADSPYVSRGGLKLEAALDYFDIDVTGKVVMDVGSSTGGFTDCLLKRGAIKVYCIDVGYGQLAWSLRNDPRVFLLERTNIRYLGELIESHNSKLSSAVFDDLRSANIDIATVDVSFISLSKVIPVVIRYVKQTGELLALVKPQFEVGKGEVGKGGIVREAEKRMSAVGRVREEMENLGLRTLGIFPSPIPGQKGNIEYFLYVRRQ